MADKDWEYTITPKDEKFVEEVNDVMVDLDKKVSGGTKKTKGTGSSTPPKPTTPPAGGGKGSGPGAPKPPKVVKPPKTTPKTPPKGGGSGGSKGGKPKMSGGHSTKTSRVRGIQDLFKGSIDFKEASSWISAGGFPGNDGELKSLDKWDEFKSVYSVMRKKLKKIQSEEISDSERGFWGGKKLEMQDWMQGKDKYFSRILTPDRDTTDVNVMLALDASGSTGSDRQHNMSGVTLAMVKALENTRTKFSLMVYDHRMSIVEVDKVGKSTNTLALAGDYCGMGGNNEGMVLDVAKEIARKNADAANILLIVSDGGVANVKERIITMKKQMKNAPFSIYCMGYGSDFDEMYAQEIFGEGYAIGSATKKAFANNMIKVIAKEVDMATRGGE